MSIILRSIIQQVMSPHASYHCSNKEYPDYRLQKQTGKSQEKARKQVKTKPRISQSKQIKRKQDFYFIFSSASQAKLDFFIFKRKPSKIFISFSGASKQSNISSANQAIFFIFSSASQAKQSKIFILFFQAQAKQSKARFFILFSSASQAKQYFLFLSASKQKLYFKHRPSKSNIPSASQAKAKRKSSMQKSSKNQVRISKVSGIMELCTNSMHSQAFILSVLRRTREGFADNSRFLHIAKISPARYRDMARN
jgi:hypothetical protein